MSTVKARRIPAGIMSNLERPGHQGTTGLEGTPSVAAHDKAAGLELSELLYKPITFFKPHPDNQVFDSMKGASYLASLRKDIEDARAIIDPLVAMPDGTIVEGHSRLRIATLMEEAGHGLGKLPVRLILSELSTEQVRERVYLGNLSRFEIDASTRALLYSRIWPGYFLEEPRSGRPRNGDTVSPFPRVESLAETIGSTPRQIQRLARTTRKAKILAKADGRDTITLEDIEVVQNAESRQRNATLRNYSASVSGAGTKLSPHGQKKERYDAQNTDRVGRFRIRLLVMQQEAESAAGSGSREEWHHAQAAAFAKALAILDSLGF